MQDSPAVFKPVLSRNYPAVLSKDRKRSTSIRPTRVIINLVYLPAALSECKFWIGLPPTLPVEGRRENGGTTNLHPQSSKEKLLRAAFKL